jgi:hypothetical protein
MSVRAICFFILLGGIVSCALKKPKSREEAIAKMEAGIRHGILTKDDEALTLSNIAYSDLPTISRKPINLNAIDDKAASYASRMGGVAELNLMYNRGAITRSKLDAMVTHQLQVCAVEENNKRIKRAQVAMAIAGGLSAAAAGLNAQQPTAYPTYQPTPTLYSNTNQFNSSSLSNPYGAGSPYKPDGLMNPYSQYGSPYSNTSWRNPYATNAPKIVSDKGKYHGRLSTNKYDSDSTSNPYGRYGSKYSPDSINNPYGAGSPYSGTKYYVVPQR